MAAEDKPPARTGLAVGNLLLPLGVLAGALAGPQVLRGRTGLSTLTCWLLGAPAGAVIGLTTAFGLLVALNAALRLARRR